MAHVVRLEGLAMGRFPTWAKFWVVVAAGLLSPVLAFLMAMAVECSIGVIRDLGALPVVAFIVVAAIGRTLIRKARARPQGSAAIET
jgi:hypothetical protein